MLIYEMRRPRPQQEESFWGKLYLWEQRICFRSVPEVVEVNQKVMS